PLVSLLQQFVYLDQHGDTGAVHLAYVRQIQKNRGYILVRQIVQRLPELTGIAGINIAVELGAQVLLNDPCRKLQFAHATCRQTFPLTCIRQDRLTYQTPRLIPRFGDCLAYLRDTDPPRKLLLTWPVFTGSLALSGFAPRARGTAGTAVCLVAALLLWWLAGWHRDAWLPLAAVFTGLSLLSGAAVLRLLPKIKDPGWFVLDEAAAFFLTLGLLRADSLLAIFAGFLTFRFYDIAKPWPVRSFE